MEKQIFSTKWCKAYGCWCDDVEEITDWQYRCDLNCVDCDDLEYINRQ